MRKIVILLTAILGVAFVAVAFNKAVEKENGSVVTQEAVVFHYASEDTSPDAFANPDNWESGNSPLPCGNGQQKPCEKEAADEDDLASILAGRTNEDILKDPTFSTRN